MKTVLIALLMTLVPLVSAAQECQKLDNGQGPYVFSGVVDMSWRTVEGDNLQYYCHRLFLDVPLCVTDEEGRPGTPAKVIQITSKTPGELPQTGRISVNGFLSRVLKGTWCEDALVNATSFEALPDDDASSKLKTPQYSEGAGSLGYGAPDRVVADVEFWSHPVRAVLQEGGFDVEGVLYFLDGHYPVFFLNRLTANSVFAHCLVDKDWPDRILKANFGWAFEIVDSDGTRYRYSKFESAAGLGLVRLDF